MVQGAGGVQADHGQAVDGEQPEQQPLAQYGRPDQQGGGACNGQDRAQAVGDGRPGPQAVVGVPDLRPAAGPDSLYRGGGHGVGGHSVGSYGVGAHGRHSFQRRQGAKCSSAYSISKSGKNINIKYD